MDKKISNLTKQKYDLFVAAYIRCFNATKAAVEAGYKASNAKNQGSNMLTNPYIKKKIDTELGRLRQRFADEGNRAFADLLNILSDLDIKLRRHDEAELKITELENDLIILYEEMSILNRASSKLESKAKAIDGRKADSKKAKAELVSLIDEKSDELFELEVKVSKINREIRILYMNILKPAQWEKMLSLKADVLQDILDRGGFKSSDRLELGGAIEVNNPVAKLTDEELRSLAYGIKPNST